MRAKQAIRCLTVLALAAGIPTAVFAQGGARPGRDRPNLGGGGGGGGIGRRHPQHHHRNHFGNRSGFRFSFGSPYYGYGYNRFGFGYSPWYTSSYYSGYYGTPYVLSPFLLGGYSSLPLLNTGTPSVVNQPVIVVTPNDGGRVLAYPPAAVPQGGYYLEGRPAPAADLVDVARRHLRVTLAEPGVYLVRWAGPAAGVRRVEFQVLGAEGKALTTQAREELPFRALLRLPAEAKAVTVSVERKDGTSSSVKLPVDEFKKLSD